MSESENLLSFELLVCSDPIFLPRPIHAGADRVYAELATLAELMPERYREVFSFRWGP